MNLDINFKAYRVNISDNGEALHSIENMHVAEVLSNNILVKVEYSSLNYKDALSASGNQGVTRHYPHTPGIDAVGTIAHTESSKYKIGDKVIVTGYDLGMNTDGGFGEYINVPDFWAIPLPNGLSPKESMTIGTAGFTAALMVHHLLRCSHKPYENEVLVTGASGGVGSLAVNIASKVGFKVVASTGKADSKEYLLNLGANSIIHRDEVIDKSGKALAKGRWDCAIDTVGGSTLESIIKSLKKQGSVVACGNVASAELNTTVFPFILNGVNLLGVNTSSTPHELRKYIWEKLAGEWKPDFEKIITETTNLENLNSYINKILKGQISGRIVVKHE